MKGSTVTDTDEHWDFGVTKTGEYKVQDIYGGETSGGALDLWPSNWIEPEEDEELFDLGDGWLPRGGGRHPLVPALPHGHVLARLRNARTEVLGWMSSCLELEWPHSRQLISPKGPPRLL